MSRSKHRNVLTLSPCCSQMLSCWLNWFSLWREAVSPKLVTIFYHKTRLFGILLPKQHSDTWICIIKTEIAVWMIRDSAMLCSSTLSSVILLCTQFKEVHIVQGCTMDFLMSKILECSYDNEFPIYCLLHFNRDHKK